MSQCTCRIVQTKTIVSRPLTPGDFAIDWCPLHAAAPVLLSALRGVLNTIGPRAETVTETSIVEIVETAMEHAEGRG